MLFRSPAEAVAHLKRASSATAREKKMPDPLEMLNTAALVPHLLKVLGIIGFVVNRGKIIGTKSAEKEEVILQGFDDSDDENDAPEDQLRLAA